MSTPENSEQELEQIRLILKELGTAELYQAPSVTPLNNKPQEEERSSYRPR